MIKDSLFTEENAARRRVAFLKRNGFAQAHYVWLPNYENSLRVAMYGVLLTSTTYSSADAMELLKTVKKNFAIRKMGISQVEIIEFGQARR